MAKQIIQLGSGANSGDGDPIRTAFTKVNANFNELYNYVVAIPAAQVPSDWNATSGYAQILNKPTIPAAYTLPPASPTTLGGVKIGAGISIDGSGVISASGAAAGLITGTTLSPNVVTSSLTTVGTLINLSVTNPIAGSVTGNAGTVTNGVYTTGTYSNPSWITSLQYSKLIGAPTFAAVATSGSYADLTGKPNAYALPAATSTSLGGVIPDGTTISISGTGAIAVAAGGHTHNASTLSGTTLAANVVTSSLTTVGTITNGTWSGSFGAVSGTNLTSLNASNLSSGTVPIARLSAATTSALGIVQPDGSTITVSGGVISSVLPLATTSTLGGVKVDGTTITISGGVISAPSANTASSLSGTTLASNVVNSSLTSVGTLTSLTVAGTITSTGAGTPTLTSSTNINLAAANAVVVTASPFRLASFSTTARNALSPSNGDMIYNTTVNKFQGYQNGAWVNLDTGAAA